MVRQEAETRCPSSRASEPAVNSSKQDACLKQGEGEDCRLRFSFDHTNSMVYMCLCVRASMCVCMRTHTYKHKQDKKWRKKVPGNFSSLEHTLS